MSSLNKLRAIKNSIIFTFVEDISAGMFHSTTKSGLAIVEAKDKQLKVPRWGKVVKIGPEVSDEVKEGTYILVEPLMWTTNTEFEGEKFWVTNESKIFAVADFNPVK
jgi:co-chaperonin GroES (HSP10)